MSGGASENSPSLQPFPKGRGGEELRVAVIGAGLIAQNEHLPAWQDCPGASVVAVADVSEPVAVQAAEKFGVPRHVLDYRELLDDPSIDVIDLCLPSALHAEAAIAALQAGKHVFCEKPLTTSRRDAARVLAAWRTSGKKLMVGQHLRFNAMVQSLRGFLGERGLGHVYFARAQWLRRRRLPGKAAFTDKKLSGGGALYDLGVHLLDLTWWMMGCPRPVAASGATFSHLARRGDLGSEWGEWNSAKIDVEDFAAGFIRFENGAVLSLEATWLAFTPEAEMWQVQWLGDRGGAVWPEGRICGETAGQPWDIQLAPPAGPKPHKAILHAFAQAVINDQPVPIPPRQSAQVIAMLDALYESAAGERETTVEMMGES